MRLENVLKEYQTYQRIHHSSNVHSVRERKMVKKGGNKTTEKDNFIPGQAYHMDLAFVSGPLNLDVNGGSNSASSPIVK
jgi:hypothetical protein